MSAHARTAPAATFARTQSAHKSAKTRQVAAARTTTRTKAVAERTSRCSSARTRRAMHIWIFYHRFARVNSGESRATRGEDPSCRDKVLRRRLILRKGERGAGRPRAMPLTARLTMKLRANTHS